MTKEMETAQGSEPTEILPESISKMPAAEAAPLLARASSRIHTLGWKGEFWDGVRENFDGASAWIKAGKANLVKKTLSAVTGVSLLTSMVSACTNGPGPVIIPSETSPRIREVSPTTAEVTPTSTETQILNIDIRTIAVEKGNFTGAAVSGEVTLGSVEPATDALLAPKVDAAMLAIQEEEGIPAGAPFEIKGFNLVDGGGKVQTIIFGWVPEVSKGFFYVETNGEGKFVPAGIGKDGTNGRMIKLTDWAEGDKAFSGFVNENGDKIAIFEVGTDRKFWYTDPFSGAKVEIPGSQISEGMGKAMYELLPLPTETATPTPEPKPAEFILTDPKKVMDVIVARTSDCLFSPWQKYTDGSVPAEYKQLRDLLHEKGIVYDNFTMTGGNYPEPMCFIAVKGTFKPYNKTFWYLTVDGKLDTFRIIVKSP